MKGMLSLKNLASVAEVIVFVMLICNIHSEFLSVNSLLTFIATLLLSLIWKQKD